MRSGLRLQVPQRRCSRPIPWLRYAVQACVVGWIGPCLGMRIRTSLPALYSSFFVASTVPSAIKFQMPSMSAQHAESPFLLQRNMFNQSFEGRHVLQLACRGNRWLPEVIVLCFTAEGVRSL